MLFRSFLDMIASEWNRHITANLCAILTCNILCCIILYRNYILTNEAYLRLQLEYESTYSFATRVAYSIENNENYTLGKPVYISGHFNYAEYPTRRKAFNEFSEFTGIFSDYIIYTQEQLTYFLKDTLNLTYTEPDSELLEQIKSSKVYINMPAYPENGSVQDIDGVLVVKLSEE